MKQIIVVCLWLCVLFFFNLPVVYSDINVFGQVRGRMDEASGPGVVVVQGDYDSKSGHEVNDANRSSASGHSSGKGLRGFRCVDWNNNVKNGSLILQDGFPAGASKDAYLLLVYMQGVLDTRNMYFDEDMWDEINRQCIDNPQGKLANVVSCSWWKCW